MSGELVEHRGGCHCGAVRFVVGAPSHLLVLDCKPQERRTSGGHEGLLFTEGDGLEKKRPRLESAIPEAAYPLGLPSLPVTADGSPAFHIKRDMGFPGKVEHVSPPSTMLPSTEDLDGSPSKLSIKELLQSMDRVEREIAKVEQAIAKLRKKQQQLEVDAAKPVELEKPVSPPPVESKHHSMAQIIYDENRVGRGIHECAIHQLDVKLEHLPGSITLLPSPEERLQYLYQETEQAFHHSRVTVQATTGRR
uniref:nuclear receptor corepressor 1-like isoform X3 n=1 Tax=Myxine glutinosa TaxID=7769 RepID=UPI00358F0010